MSQKVKKKCITSIPNLCKTILDLPKDYPVFFLFKKKVCVLSNLLGKFW